MRSNKAILLAAIALFALPSCANQTEAKTYIGIISAMDNEVSLLLEHASIKEKRTVGGITFHVGTLQGKDVVISPSGIGKIRCASGITSMLSLFDISSVIFTGIAGGTRDEESVLDEVIATSLVEHDYGYVTNDGFVWAGGDPGMQDPGEEFYPDKGLVDLAYQSALSVMEESHIFKGCIATGDQFIASKDYVEGLVRDFDAYACEMEGAAAAKVCTAYETPFAILRTLSDKADGEAGGSYLNFGDLAAMQSNRIVLKMLESM